METNICSRDPMVNLHQKDFTKIFPKKKKKNDFTKKSYHFIYLFYFIYIGVGYEVIMAIICKFSVFWG